MSGAAVQNEPRPAGAWQRLTARPGARACLWVTALFTLTALYGEISYRYDSWRDRTPSYQVAHMDKRYLPPSAFRRPWQTARTELGAGAPIHRVAGRAAAHLLEHPLGTDNLGRDVLQRLVQGTRLAFHVGVVTSLIAIPIGVALGCLGGYFGGILDAVVVWLYSTVAAMPGLLFILAIALVVGKGMLGVYLGIGLTTWVGICRLMRAEVLKHRARPYVTAARVLGYSDARILLRHILPNVAHIILIVFSIRFPAAVSTEVFMSFVGIGAQNEPSWGIMLNNARLRLWQGAWWELGSVSAALFLVVLALNLLGDYLRDVLDPRLNAGE